MAYRRLALLLLLAVAARCDTACESQAGGEQADVCAAEAAGPSEGQRHRRAAGGGDGTALSTFSVENVMIGRFLSVARVPAADSGAKAPSGGGPGELEGSCHDAVPGEACHRDTVWAKEYAINTRPQWYPGLTSSSSFADFQAHLHHCYWARCPMPCASTGRRGCGMVGRFWSGAASCQDATEGSNCYGEIRWARDHGIKMFPDWYPSLTEHSSDREFQMRLFRGQQAGYEDNDCAEPCCHDTLPGERCYEDAEWAKLHGIGDSKISHIYPPHLTNQSSLSEFQAYLHLCYADRCPEPCTSTETMASHLDVGLDCPADAHKHNSR